MQIAIHDVETQIKQMIYIQRKSINGRDMTLSIQCSIRIISIAIYILTIHTVATAKATKSVFYNVSHIISKLSYNEQALIYAIQGIVNKRVFEGFVEKRS